MTKKRAGKGRAGFSRPETEGDWLSTTQIALRVGKDQKTVAKYLRQSGAPEPNDKKQWFFPDAEAYLDEVANPSDSMLLLKEDILRIEKEERAMKLAIKKGLYITKQEAASTLGPLMAELAQLMREKFILEFPGKAVGRSAADIQILAEEYLTEINRRFREGTLPITTNAT